MATESSAPQMETLVNRLQNVGSGTLPLHEKINLQHHSRRVTMTVMCEAWRQSGRTPEEPGVALQVYFPEQDILLVDLS